MVVDVSVITVAAEKLDHYRHGCIVMMMVYGKEVEGHQGHQHQIHRQFSCHFIHHGCKVS